MGPVNSLPACSFFPEHTMIFPAAFFTSAALLMVAWLYILSKAALALGSWLLS